MKRSTIVLLSIVLCSVGAILALAQEGPTFKTADHVFATPGEYQRATGKSIERFGEAPALAELVKQGKLPPVEKRLPEEPLVIRPVEKVGRYGGTLTFVVASIRSNEDFQWGRPASMLRRNENVTKALPNFIKGYEFSKDYKTLTLYFRRGMRWSDGQPFTTEDVLFWWEDVLLNKELTPVVPLMWKVGGELVKFESVDDYTLRLNFALQNPAIVTWLTDATQGSFFHPKHYLKKWHIKYNPDAGELAKKEGYNSWWEAFQFHADAGPAISDPGLPLVMAWKLEELTPTRQIWARNPYYWAVDTSGNQLPYVDKVIVEVISDLETQKMKVIAGDISFYAFPASVKDYPLYKENEKKGGYRVQLARSTAGAQNHIAFNVNHPDPIKRQIFQDVRFRRALSLAINREEINKILYFGKGTPRQATAHPSVSYYKEEWATAWAQYDPKQANRLLDEMGLTKRDAEGWRIRPDGKRLIVTIEYWPREERTEFLELVKEYWEAVGIKTELKSEERSFYEQTRVMAGEHDAGVWHLDVAFELTSHYMALNYYHQLFGLAGSTGAAVKWRQWFDTDGKAGEEPPEDVKEYFGWLKEWAYTVPGTPRYVELARRLYGWHADRVYIIGAVGLVPRPIIVKNELRNVPMEGGIYGWDNHWIRSYLPEQWYLEK
ncbi:MAG: ABC transporter substrate-binding protein [bacterium]